MEQGMSRKHRRQRAWVRVILRWALPRLLTRIHLQALQRRAAIFRWWAARVEARNVRRMKQWVAQQRIDANAPCPACGARDGEIRFTHQYGCIIHRCKVCTALWPEKPIVAWADWKVEIGEDKLPEPLELIEAWQKERMKPPGLTVTNPPVKTPVN